jgi:hypothetical protein
MPSEYDYAASTGYASGNCNESLGLMADTVERLMRAADYLLNGVSNEPPAV